MSYSFAKLIVNTGGKTKPNTLDPGPNRPKSLEMPSPNGGSALKNTQVPLPTDLYKRFIITPGTRVKVEDLEPGYHGLFRSPDEATMIVDLLSHRLDDLQHRMYAERKHALLIVLQGLDASGKDGVIRHLVETMNPAGCRVAAFKRPTPEELSHDFLWRVHSHVPARGEVAIFNRSHYEDVLAVRVHHLTEVNIWTNRYDLINAFEEMLARQNNTTILKFFLHISKEEQLVRFEQRLSDPSRQWKVSEDDYRERLLWDKYMVAFEDMLVKTSTESAPWFVIPSNYKWFRDLAISQIIVQTLEELAMRWPEPSVNIADIRRRYHSAASKASTPRTPTSIRIPARS